MNEALTSKVFLTWDIHYKCNYHCAYCFLHFEPATSNINNIYLKNDKWLEIWSNIYQKYGASHVFVTGGEPFIYPNFIDLISKLTEMHTFEFSTNFSWDVVEFAKKVSPGKVKINTSFHPEFTELKDFLKKIAYLKEKNYFLSITIVAYPPLIDKLSEYNKHIQKLGCSLIIYPYRGPYENRNYPDGYTDKEMAILKQFGLELGVADIHMALLQKYQLEKDPAVEKRHNDKKDNKETKICHMGQHYAKLMPDGEAYRCCAAVNKGWGELGNFIKGTFMLTELPSICPYPDQCRCYKAMIAGEEKKWQKQWVDVRGLQGVEKEKKLLEEAKNYQVRGDINRGIEKIKEILETNPRNIEALVLLAEWKLEQKEYTSCNNMLSDILKNYPDSGCESWIYRISGRLYAALGVKEKSFQKREDLFDKAGQYFNKCLKIANGKNNLADRARGYYEAASFYLLRKNHKMARESIGSAVQYEPRNESFLRLARRIELEEDKLTISGNSDKEKITFGWDLCYSCNYRCPYCGVWETASDKDLFLSPEKWIIIWDRIFDNYGSCHIFMSGGEPSVYQGFFELVKKLTIRHSIELCTNLSWEVESLISEVSPGRLKIAPTFHPSQADFSDFLKKSIKVKEYLPNAQIYYVAYSGQQIIEMPQRSRMLKEQGIDLIPYPLRGNQVVLNTEEEKRIIREVSPYKGEKIEYQLNKISPKGKLCRAGQHYAVIRGDGSVDRCSQYRNGQIGSFLDKDFRLFDKAKPCEKEYCPIESQWIIT